MLRQGRAMRGDMNERYELVLPKAGMGTLTASSLWGLLRGLEKFSQMVDETPSGVFTIRAAPVRVVDFPR